MELRNVTTVAVLGFARGEIGDPGMDTATPLAQEAAEAQPPAVRACLSRVLASPGFVNAPKRARLLSYLVDAATAPAPKPLSEYGIGLDVFDRPASFDPKLDSIVRTELSRLRQKLKDYYADPACNDPLAIEIPARSYVPVFVPRPPSNNAAQGTGPTRPISRFVVPLLIGVLIAVAGFTLYRFWTARPAPAVATNSIVVLPFQNLSSSHDQEYLADGVTEELTNELAQRTELHVVARTSAFQFKGKGVDIRTIGRALNAAVAVEGSIDAEGNRVRVTAQLNRTSDGYHLWSRSYEVARSDLLLAESQVSAGVLAALGLSDGASRHTGSTHDPTAHDLYLQGRYQLSLATPQSYRDALELFRAAVAKDPSYVAAYIGVAQGEIDVIHITAGEPKQGLERARAALKKAISVDPASADAHGMMGYIAYNYDWDWPRAEQEYKLALDEGAQSQVHSFYAAGLASRGRFAEAQEQFAVAEDLDPLSTGIRFNEALAFYLAHRYTDARSVLSKMLAVNPKLLSAHLFLGLSALAEHDCRRADAEFGWAARTYPMPVTTNGLAFAAACHNNVALARRYLSDTEAYRGPDFVSPYQLAMGYAMIGDKDSTFHWLKKSADAREGQIMYLLFDPAFDGVRGDPRYVAVETRVGLK